MTEGWARVREGPGPIAALGRSAISAGSGCQHNLSAARAFDILVWRSQETNVKVRALAARFLTAISGRMSSATLSEVDHILLTLK